METIHSALGGFTPAQIMFGRRLNVNLKQPVQDDTVVVKSRVVDFVVKLQLALERANKIVLDLVKQKEFDNIKPSLGKRLLSYDVGDKVGLHVEYLPAGVKSKKLFPRYSGPFTVEKALHDGKVLYLMDVHGKIRKVPVSINNVKPWPDRQTLLEQFEKYEVLKRKVPTPSLAGTLVSAPTEPSVLPSTVPVTIVQNPVDSLPDMVIDEVIITPKPIEPLVVVQTTTPNKPLNEPLVLDYRARVILKKILMSWAILLIMIMFPFFVMK